jgi:GNAT superfamily N-acetyltransferase
METDQDLETGYGVASPPGDNLCNDYAQALALAYVELATARGERTVVDDPLVAMTDGSSPSPFGNVVVLRRPVPDAEWPALAERVHGFFAGRGGGPYLTFSAWPTPDLSTLGFGRVGHPPLMYRPTGPIDDQPVPGLDVRLVTDESTARDWERTLVEAYPDPSQLPFRAGRFLPQRALDAPNWRHWVGYLEGEAVATSSAYIGPHHVDVEMISTRPEVRGRGVGRAVTVAATLAAPDRPAMLISSDDGRPVYTRLGYVSILRFTMWLGHRQ